MNSRWFFDKSLLLLLLGTLTVALSGCGPIGPSYQPLYMHSVTLLPSVRVENNIYGRDKAKTIDVEGGGAWARGKNSQLLTGQARIGDTTFPSAQTLNTDFNISFYDATLRWRHFIANGPVGYEVAQGVGYTRLHFGASAASLHGDETVISPDLEFTIGGMVRFGKKTRFEADRTYFRTKSNLTGVSRYQLSLVHAFGKHAAVQGGYSKWRAASPSANRSNVAIQSSGPSIGVRFIF